VFAADLKWKWHKTTEISLQKSDDSAKKIYNDESVALGDKRPFYFSQELCC
jgi:hypothetical protein